MDGGTSLSKCPRFFLMAVSRILSSRRSRDDLYGHLSRKHLAVFPALASCDYYPEDSEALSRLRNGQATRFLLFCLAPHGVFRAPGLAPGAVGSYPAFSPLPRDQREAVCFL